LYKDVDAEDAADEAAKVAAAADEHVCNIVKNPESFKKQWKIKIISSHNVLLWCKLVLMDIG